MINRTKITRRKLTDQKLKDKRYRRTEEAIIEAFFLVKDNLSLSKIVKTAKISRSTMLRHHGSIYQVVPDYEEYILRKYRRLAKKMLKNKATLGAIFQRTLVFVLAHQRIFKFILHYGDRTIIEKLLQVLAPSLASVGKIRNETILRLLIKEISGLIEDWANDGFERRATTTLTRKLTNLTYTATERLSAIL